MPKNALEAVDENQGGNGPLAHLISLSLDPLSVVALAGRFWQPFPAGSRVEVISIAPSLAVLSLDPFDLI